MTQKTEALEVMLDYQLTITRDENGRLGFVFMVNADEEGSSPVLNSSSNKRWTWCGIGVM